MQSLEATLVSSKFINRLGFTLGFLVILLCLAHLVFIVFIPDSPPFFQFQLNVDLEGNWATWFNSTLDLVAGIAALLIAWLSTVRQQRYSMVGWLLAAAIFIYLSMDDAAGIHDWLSNTVALGIDWLGITTPIIQEYKYRMWMVVLGVPGLIASLVMLRFITRDVWETPRARWLIIAGFLLLVSNPLTEVVESNIIAAAGYETFPGLEVIKSEHYSAWQQLQWVTIVQEATEMLSMVLFAAGFLYAGQALILNHQSALKPFATVSVSASGVTKPT
jgi:hypothetical protein